MTREMNTEIAVVGAGPAGLSAAIAAAKAGARVTVLDEYPEPGGQFYKQLAAPFRAADRSRLPKDYTKGDVLLASARDSGATILNDALVWGTFQGGELSVLRKGEPGTLRAGAIIVATGAHERPIAFPGWDLPGVMTPGGAQTLVKNQQVAPGRRILLAGSGPFLLPVARTLIEFGADVAGIVEATRQADWLKFAPRFWGHWDRIAEALEYRRIIARAGVPFHYGEMVVRAEGRECVERAVLARCGAGGRPVPGSERTIEADTVCVGYGFVPQTQLVRGLGCDHHYDAWKGGWVPRHTAMMETSVPGVYVAGEVAGIGGAWCAQAEGSLAGLAAAQRLGFAVDMNEVARHQAERARRREFGDMMNEMFAVRPGYYEPISDDTLVCRCEEVTAREVRAAAVETGATLKHVKGVTRCGMGYCQGRICGSIVDAVASKALGLAPGELDALPLRPPYKPVRVADLARLARDG